MNRVGTRTMPWTKALEIVIGKDARPNKMVVWLWFVNYEESQIRRDLVMLETQFIQEGMGWLLIESFALPK